MLLQCEKVWVFHDELLLFYGDSSTDGFLCSREQ